MVCTLRYIRVLDEEYELRVVTEINGIRVKDLYITLDEHLEIDDYTFIIEVHEPKAVRYLERLGFSCQKNHTFRCVPAAKDVELNLFENFKRMVEILKPIKDLIEIKISTQLLVQKCLVLEEGVEG
jgi:hypothetical protein